MLFDLRGRGRRRTVQIIYVGLAVIFLLGFVGLGVGGGFGSGGIFSAFTNREGSGGASFSGEIKKYQKLTRAQPSNLGAWEKLISAELHEAGNEAYVTRAGAVTSRGKELYVQVGQSWERYVALNPPKPNAELALRMVPVFGEQGLNNPAATVGVLQIVVASRPTSASLYAQLAIYAYKARNIRVGDLAAEKAVSLAPAAQRLRLKTEFAAFKKNPSGSESATASATTVKSAASGTLTGTAQTTTSGKKK